MKTSLPVIAVLLAACASQPTPMNRVTPVAVASIERAEIEAAQRSWCDALLSIAAENSRGGDAKAAAEAVLAKAYNYDRGTVLFKPTLTHGEQTFRMDKRGALAYFVGGDSAYPDDQGFARKPWTSCRPEIASIAANGSGAIAMGNVYLSDKDGKQVKVDKTFGYVRDEGGQLRIMLHHSSLAYQP